MQLDMHFYGVYALARAAGVNPETARKIANASQYVDDALESDEFKLEDQTAVVPTMTSHKPLDYLNKVQEDQWRVWVPFHFLPGCEGNTFEEKMVCQKAIVRDENEVIIKKVEAANGIVQHAIDHRKETYGPHLAGIIAHVYADTFAHYGFQGISSKYNKVKQGSIKLDIKEKNVFRYVSRKFEKFFARSAGTVAEIIPVGHGSVSTYPDRPYLNWKYELEENDEVVRRNNLEDFLGACRELHAFFVRFVDNNPECGDAEKQVECKKPLGQKFQSILVVEASKDKRIERWKEAIASGDLFNATDEDKHVSYNERQWRSEHIFGDFSDIGSLRNCDAFHFIKAAWSYRNFVLHELLPASNLIA